MTPDERRERAEQILDETPAEIGRIGQTPDDAEWWHRVRVERYLNSLGQGLAALNAAAVELLAAVRALTPALTAVAGVDKTAPLAGQDDARSPVEASAGTSVTPETAEDVSAAPTVGFRHPASGW